MIKIEIKSKIIDYIKRHWKELLIVALFATLFIKGKMDYASLYNMHIETTKQYDLRIEKLNIAHKEQLEKKNEAIKEYIQRVESIRNQYDTDKEELRNNTDNKKEEIQQILLEKPEELVKEMENKFGFKYVE
tara:strand:+ start:1200 stop:1595 length:396 start_codon:yes stop_codon:yes gene_type:complete